MYPTQKHKLLKFILFLKNLLVFVEIEDMYVQDFTVKYPRKKEVPFNHETKSMSVICEVCFIFKSSL